MILHNYKRYDESSTEWSVQAAKLTKDNAEELAHLTGSFVIQEVNPLNPEETFVGINVRTPEGMKRASEGDYVILQDHNWHVRPPMGFEMNWELI